MTPPTHGHRLPGTWPPGYWLNEPAWATDGQHVTMEAAEGSDLWRTTCYGFVKDSAHAFLTRLDVGMAVEADLRIDMQSLYDQAGVLVRSSPVSWVKTGLEFFDGAPHLGAVVTHGASDWSSHPVPSWHGDTATIRVSRGVDSLTLRARRAGGPWQLVRLAPLQSQRPVYAGPYCCAPSRAGFSATFERFTALPGDRSLHCEPAVVS